MHRSLFFVITAVLFIFATESRAADLSIKPDDQVVRVNIADEAQLKALHELDLDVWSHEHGVGPVDVHVSAAERAALDKLGLPYDVLIEDLKALQEAEEARHLLRGLGPFDDYMNPADMIAFINGLAAARPDLCQVIDIGNSLQNRDIWVLHITGTGVQGGPPAGQRPGVFYHGLQHCREWITGAVTCYIADYLVSNYDSDPCVKALVDRTDFYLAPCVNPDGYEYTWTTQRLWRKNRRNNGDGTFGVDLNRNWGYQWGFDNSGSSPVTSSETYRGTGPFSEPETQVLRDFILARPNIRAYMDYHSYSELILWPWGYTSALPPAQATFSAVGNAMRSLIAAVHGHFYVAGPIYTTIYPANGGSADWVYGANDILAYSIELRDTGAFGFLLPAEQIIPTCEENLAGILHLSRWASFGLLLDAQETLPAIVEAGQPSTVSVRISPANEAYMPGSGACRYRFASSGAFGSVPLTFVSGDVYQAQLPAAPCGAPVEYYFAATDASGAEYTFPCDAPTGVYHSRAAELLTIHFDDLETDTGWTVGAPGDNATTGIWGRMDPQPTTAQPGDDHTPAPGVICYVTDGRAGTSVGTYDIDGGRTTLTTPSIDVSAATDPQIGYWRWYSNNAGAAPNSDVFVVDLSVDGGANWMNVENVGPSGPGTGGGWFYHEFRLLDFVGTLPSSVRLRFIASDYDPGSIVEAAIDDLIVRDIRCTCPTVPGDLNGDDMVNALDIAGFADVLLNAPYYAPCADVATPFSTFIVDSDDFDGFVELLLTQ